MTDRPIKLELSVTEVNTVLEALGKEPFISVYQLIARIQEQAQQQLNGQPPEAAEAADSDLTLPS